MSAEEQFKMFEAQTAWLHAENVRLLKIIQTPRVKKHQAWKQLLEINSRTVQCKREFNRFLENA
jgi:hypothetical protein